MKKIALFILACIIFQTLDAQPAKILKSSILQNANYSVYAMDAENGAVIFETPQKSLVPASVMKIVTTAAAMEILGARFYLSYPTGLYRTD